jgi:hypothetical protein
MQVAPATLILSAAQTMRANEGSKPQPSTSPKQLSRFRTEDDAAIALEAALENPRTLNQVRASQLPLEKRYVFLSPMYLAAQLDAIPQLTRSRCILVFPCARESLFPPKHDKARRKAAATYMSPQFRKWVQQKEEMGLVFFFKPDRNWVALSDFFEKLTDPMTGQPYTELLLDAAWWRTKFLRTCARYQPQASAIAELFTSSASSWDVPSIQELIYQSNPGMEPVERWPYAPQIALQIKEPKSDIPKKQMNYKGYVSMEHGLLSPAAADIPARVRLEAEATRLGSGPGAFVRTPMSRRDNLQDAWASENARRKRLAATALIAVSPRTTLGANSDANSSTTRYYPLSTT